ncbi:hypothetical protein M8818_005771 [Zalaria obscura]|uniref:Uncharacterized protein n=1 Tax=Zalaria obscura TaxID=2024903 RepID=A0ACC3S8X5_9PEZI
MSVTGNGLFTRSLSPTRRANTSQITVAAVDQRWEIACSALIAPVIWRSETRSPLRFRVLKRTYIRDAKIAIAIIAFVLALCEIGCVEDSLNGLVKVLHAGGRLDGTVVCKADDGYPTNGWVKDAGGAFVRDKQQHFIKSMSVQKLPYHPNLPNQS